MLLTTAGMHPLVPYFRGEEQPPHPRLTSGPEVLPHDRHRERRQHHAAPDVLRDARQLLDRRLLQAGGRRDGLGALAGGLRLRPRRHLDHGLRGRRGARPGPGRGGDRGLARGRRAARADRAVPALGELLAGRRQRSVRAVQRAVHRPRPGVGHARTTCPAARTSASSSTGTSSSRSTTSTTHADGARPRAAAREQHRHRPRPRADGGHPAGRRHDLRDRHVRAADGARPRAGDRAARRARAADPRRPLARADVPDRRRRRAVQRGSRLHPAPDHAPRDPAGPPDRDRARLPAALRRAGHRDDGRRLPGARSRARVDPAVGALGGGGLRSHARAGHAAAGGDHRALRATPIPPTPRSPPTPPSSCTTRSASRSR